MLKVPLSEWSCINFNNAILDESLGTNELVVGSVVHNIRNLGLSAYSLRSPRESTFLNAKCAMFNVSTSYTNLSHLSGTQFGVSCHSTHFEVSFFLVDWHATTSGSPLVSRIPRNTHSS